MSNIIEVKNFVLYCNDKLIFDDISFNISKKDFVTIMGANGSGKSLLASVLIGLLPYEGNIKLDNEELSSLENEYILNMISVIMDDNEQLFVEKNVVSELMDICVNSQLLKSVIKELEIQDLLERDPRTLSVGEKQLINIACAVLEQKRIIILDNALCMLDQNNKNRVLKLLKKINDNGIVIINITQDSEEALFSKKILLFADKEVVVDENLKTAFNKEKEFCRARINLPFIAELCAKLKYYNIVSKIELDSIKLVNDIWK